MTRFIGNAVASQSKVSVAADCLLGGGVALLPTDTVFGLAALPDKPEAVANIFRLKDRPPQRNLPVMASSLEQLERIGAQINSRVERLVNSPYCPGPLSIAVGLRPHGLPKWLEGRDELAFRMPKDDFLLRLLDAVGPLLVTSANRHGMGTLGTVEDALNQLAGSPDLVVCGRECGSVPSTLVNCRFAPPVIERVGAVPAEALFRYLVQ